MTRLQYGISALVSQTFCRVETSDVVAKCLLFSQARKAQFRPHYAQEFRLNPRADVSCPLRAYMLLNLVISDVSGFLKSMVKHKKNQARRTINISEMIQNQKSLIWKHRYLWTLWLNSWVKSWRALHMAYYSFQIFLQFWLAKSTRIIHHNQFLITKFGRILCLTKKWRQKCSVRAG